MPDYPHGAYQPGSPGRAPAQYGGWAGGRYYSPGQYFPPGTSDYTLYEQVHIPERFRTGQTNREYITVVATFQVGTRQRDRQAEILRLGEDVVLNGGRGGTNMPEGILPYWRTNMRRYGTLTAPADE